MVKLRDLEYLAAIAEYRHFGKAADACFVSQPTLSGQIMKLEEQLGLQLVERHKRGIMLTPAGEQLVNDAQVVLNAAKAFEESARTLLDPLAGNLHIGLIPTLAPYLLPLIIDDLNQQLPKINFYLYENKTKNLLRQLDEGKLDLLILPWLDEMNRFERYDLLAEPLLLAVHSSHPLAAQPLARMEDLKDEQILTLEDGHCLRDQALGYCFSAGANEDQRFKATSLETLRYMVDSNMGITLLPMLATRNQQSARQIRYIPFQDPQPQRQVSLVIRPNYARMACIRAVVSSVRESLKAVI